MIALRRHIAGRRSRVRLTTRSVTRGGGRAGSAADRRRGRAGARHGAPSLRRRGLSRPATRPRAVQRFVGMSAIFACHSFVRRLPCRRATGHQAAATARGGALEGRRSSSFIRRSTITAGLAPHSRRDEKTAPSPPSPSARSHSRPARRDRSPTANRQPLQLVHDVSLHELLARARRRGRRRIRAHAERETARSSASSSARARGPTAALPQLERARQQRCHTRRLRTTRTTAALAAGPVQPRSEDRGATLELHGVGPLGSIGRARDFSEGR